MRVIAQLCTTYNIQPHTPSKFKLHDACRDGSEDLIMDVEIHFLNLADVLRVVAERSRSAQPS